jgi:hypothetical protein
MPQTEGNNNAVSLECIKIKDCSATSFPRFGKATQPQYLHGAAVIQKRKHAAVEAAVVLLATFACGVEKRPRKGEAVLLGVSDQRQTLIRRSFGPHGVGTQRVRTHELP